MAPSCLQTQHHLGDSYMLASLTASTSRASAPSGPQLLTLKREFPDFTSVMLGSCNHNWVSSPSRPLSIVPGRQRFHFYRFFTQNDHTNDKCLQRTLTSQASIVGFFSEYSYLPSSCSNSLGSEHFQPKIPKSSTIHLPPSYQHSQVHHSDYPHPGTNLCPVWSTTDSSLLLKSDPDFGSF